MCVLSRSSCVFSPHLLSLMPDSLEVVVTDIPAAAMDGQAVEAADTRRVQPKLSRYSIKNSLPNFLLGRTVRFIEIHFFFYYCNLF